MKSFPPSFWLLFSLTTTPIFGKINLKLLPLGIIFSLGALSFFSSGELNSLNLVLSFITTTLLFWSFTDNFLDFNLGSSFSSFSLMVFLIKVKSLDKLSNLYCLKLIILPFESKVNLLVSKGLIFLVNFSRSSFNLTDFILLLFNFDSFSLFLISSSISFLKIWILGGSYFSCLNSLSMPGISSEGKSIIGIFFFPPRLF